MVKVKNTLYAYMRQNTLMLILLLIIFVAGVIFGTVGVVFLDAAQTKEIAYFVERIFSEPLSLDYKSIMDIVYTNFKLMGIIWLLGLTIIGIPFIAAVVFTRGFALGFSGSFLVKLKGVKGIMAVLLTLFPSNIFSIPLLLFACTNSIIFSLCLLKGKSADIKISKNFFAFTFSIILIACFSAGVGALQGFLSPLAVKVVSFTYGR